MATIDSTLESIMQLDFTSREVLLEILQRRQAEARRDQIATDAKKSLKDYHNGNNTALTAEEAIGRLNSL